MICFVAGQYMIYAHQHSYRLRPAIVRLPVKSTPHNSFKEKCSLCDVMHHNSMDTAVPFYAAAAVKEDCCFKKISYSFTSIQLILAAGRAPPLIS